MMAIRKLWLLISLLIAAPFLSCVVSAYAFAGDDVYQNGMGDLQARAEHGELEAQYELGWDYHEGVGVQQDDSKALHWLEKAARKGHAKAEYHLGEIYLYGRGVAPDMHKAHQLLLAAAKQGDVGSQIEVAAMYSEGWGTDVDFDESYFWYTVASRSGTAAAVPQKEALAKQLSPTQIETIEKRAQSWKPVHHGALVSYLSNLFGEGSNKSESSRSRSTSTN